MTIFLIIYAIILLVIAISSIKYADSLDNFLIAGRSQKKIFVIASMLASTIGGGLTIGTTNKAYLIGFPAFWFVASGAIAHFCQGAFLSKKVRETEAVTLPDMAKKLVSPSIGTLSSVIVLITWIGIATSQFVAAAKVVTGMTGLEHHVAVICVATFIIIYTLIGGQKSVLRSDLFQFGFLAISLCATLIWCFVVKTPSSSSIKLDIFNESFGLGDLLYNVIVLGGSYFICPMMFSRILSTDSPKSARQSSFGSGFGMILFALLVTFIGLWAKASISDLQGLDPLNFLATKSLPKLLGIMLMLSLLAAILSTGDTVLLTASGVVEHDLLKQGNVKGVRIWIAVIGVIAAFIATFQTDIIAILIKTYNGYTAGLVPALCVAIVTKDKFKMNSKLTFAAIVCGYALGMAGSFVSTNSVLAKILPMSGLAISTILSLLAIKRQNIIHS